MFKRYTHFYAKSCVHFNLSKTAIKHVNFIFLRFDYRYPNVNKYRAEVPERNSTSLEVPAEMKCGSEPSHLWNSWSKKCGSGT